MSLWTNVDEEAGKPKYLSSAEKAFRCVGAGRRRGDRARPCADCAFRYKRARADALAVVRRGSDTPQSRCGIGAA